MLFSTLRRTLAHAADRVQVEVFEGEEHVRRVRAALDQYNAWHQRECPLKAPLVLGFVLSMVLHRSVSIANLVRRLLGRFRSHGFEVGLGAVTPEAMCHARARLGFEPLAAYFAATAEEIDPAPSLAGRRVWAVDAVTFTAQDTPSNLACFGRPKSVVGKVAFLPFKVVALVDVRSRGVADIEIMRHDGCERTSALPLLEVLDSRDLVIFDRGYSAVWFLGLMAVRGVGFLSRISANWKPEVIRTLGDGDCLVEITSVVPKEYRSQLSGKRRTRLTLRMIEYRVGATASVRLLTNLLDPSAVSALALAKEYRRRWECESAFDEIKNDLAATAKGRLDLVFRSKTSDGVYQEVFVLFAVYNLVRRLMRDAAEQADVDPLHLSFTDTLFLLRHHEPARRGRQAAATLLRSRVLVDVATTLNRRPRRLRQCQRALCSTLVRFPVKDPSKRSRPFSPTPVLKKTG